MCLPCAKETGPIFTPLDLGMAVAGHYVMKTVAYPTCEGELPHCHPDQEECVECRNSGDCAGRRP